MASQKKVRWAELRTGILAVASMLLVAVLIFLLTSQGSIFSGNFHLRSYFDDSEGLNANDPVRVNGILVGYIGGIRLTGSRDPVMVDDLLEAHRDRLPESLTRAERLGLAA